MVARQSIIRRFSMLSGMGARELAVEIRTIRRRGGENLGRLLHLTDELCQAVLGPPTADSRASYRATITRGPVLYRIERVRDDVMADTAYRELDNGMGMDCGDRYALTHRGARRVARRFTNRSRRQPRVVERFEGTVDGP